MPSRTLRSCAYPGCPTLVRTGYCDVHVKYKPMTTFQRDPERQSLYGRMWQLRRVTQLTREPWCADCLARGIYTEADDVHHVERHRGDLYTFQTSPLESLCKSCHSRRTKEELRNVKE